MRSTTYATMSASLALLGVIVVTLGTRSAPRTASTPVANAPVNVATTDVEPVADEAAPAPAKADTVPTIERTNVFFAASTTAAANGAVHERYFDRVADMVTEHRKVGTGPHLLSTDTTSRRTSRASRGTYERLSSVMRTFTGARFVSQKPAYLQRLAKDRRALERSRRRQARNRTR